MPTYAAQSLSVLIGAAAGSTADTMARLCLPFLARALKLTPIDVRNIETGDGLAAVTALVKVPASGSTLGWVVTPNLPARVIDHGGGDLMRRIRLLGAVQREPIAYVSPIATPVGSVQDIIDGAAGDAGASAFGTPQTGSAPHLATLRLQSMAGSRLNIVTFPSAEAARQAAASGKVAAAALGLSHVLDDLRGGRLRGLGIADDNRAELFPDMPPLRDCGIPLTAVIRRGLAAPAGLSDASATQLRQALEAVATDPDYGGQVNAHGVQAAWINGADWTAEVSMEERELADLWATNRWLQQASG